MDDDKPDRQREQILNRDLSPELLRLSPQSAAHLKSSALSRDKEP